MIMFGDLNFSLIMGNVQKNVQMSENGRKLKIEKEDYTSSCI